MKVLLAITLLLVILIIGCSSTVPKPVELHPILGERCMIVPKGTQVGKYKAPDNGVFMTHDTFVAMIAEVIMDAKKEKEFTW